MATESQSDCVEERLARAFAEKLELLSSKAAAELAKAQGAAAAAAAELAEVKAVAAAELAAAKAVAAAELAEVKAASAAELAESHRNLAASHKDMFFFRLDAISAAASERSSADVSRRGAPEPQLVQVAAFLSVFPCVPDKAVAEAWESYRRAHVTSQKAGIKFSEARNVQPVISRLIQYAGGCQMLLREFVGKVPDEIGKDSIEPDHTLNAARDMLPNLLGAVVQIEDKLPGDLNRAVSQVLKYGRRRIRVVTREADIRGEPLHDVSTFLCGTDGHEIVFARMLSGAPSDGNFAGAVPCPCETTTPLPLLGGWDFIDASWKPPIAPPAGFAALVRMLRAPLSCFDQNGIALAAISVTITDCGSHTFDLPLGLRVGSGGTSDVYAASVTLELEDAVLRTAIRGGGAPTVPCSIKAAARAESAVIKLARFSSAAVDDQFGRESRVLRLLDAASDGMTGVLFPRLLLRGCRAGVELSGVVPAAAVAGGVAAAPAAGASSSASEHKGHSTWPFLLISPQGEAVDKFVCHALGCSDASASAASASSYTPWHQRLRLADALTQNLLDVLLVAHRQRLIHCDLRPQNVVVYNGRAVLCDWGLCVDAKSVVTRWGVPAYCDSELLEQETFVARPRVDLVAAAYFWVSVVFGGHCCEAPWVQRGDTVLEMKARRQAWFAARTGDPGEVVEPLRLCGKFLAASIGADNRKLHAALYRWPYAL